ncbi:65-kDa microtubule-associated protein 3-like [Cornus florida]|uniref:65-kDa microtubule-associated protein 3-like n=1 Tax=Cornus florida TaxID=4283 RepID=UPI00289BE688|nr:65-kDa microtubule-associated protein 3-like [Cornus florida]
MSNLRKDPLLQVETMCNSLLYELQIIWDEVGETDAERDKMLLEIEQECLEVYRRKVDQVNRCRAQLRQEIADSEAELTAICSAMGERPVQIRQSDQNPGSLKKEIRTILSQLEEMRKRKCERRNQFLEVLEQIQKISDELHRPSEYTPSNTIVDETDLSLRKLEELHRELQALHKEKSDRLKQVLNHHNTLNSLCLVLGMDFKQTINEVHPSLGDSEGSKNISNDMIDQLATTIQRLRDVKVQRMQRLQDLATSMLELWNLMDTPVEEQQMFQNVTCNIAASEHEITEPDMLSLDFINYVEAEVSRLEELKASKMKELVLKKRSELEEIFRKTRMIPESDGAIEIAIEAIESGTVDPACVLEQIELQIAKVKEEAFSRKEILEKVEKWLAASEEENWLEEYNRDENRYNAGRGAHLILKRAEKARALVNKLPGMVEALTSKTTAWEKERGTEFTYDGIRLLSMLEEYSNLRQQKEQERKWRRDQKKLQGQLIAEQEILFGSKPTSPLKHQSGKKGSKLSSVETSNKNHSLGVPMPRTPKGTPRTPRLAKKNDRLFQNYQLNHQQDDGFETSSDISANEVESTRRPFSPIPSTESETDATNLLEDLNRKHNGMSQKPLPSIKFTTPSKTISAEEEENMTPRTIPISLPSTPSTVSVSMQTAMTPAPPQEEDIEYSFEEKRAGFVLPSTRLKKGIQV